MPASPLEDVAGAGEGVVRPVAAEQGSFALTMPLIAPAARSGARSPSGGSTNTRPITPRFSITGKAALTHDDQNPIAPTSKRSCSASA